MGAVCGRGKDTLATWSGDDAPVSALVWMHGLGDTEAKWRKRVGKSIIPDLTTACGSCCLVTPRAPVSCVTCNCGMPMTSWFNMQRLPLGAEDNPPSFGCSWTEAKNSTRRIHRVLDELIENGVPPERIAIGGFSQGGTMALLAAMLYPQELACCVVFSGLLLYSDKLIDLMSKGKKNLDVLWCHGTRDDVLKPSLQKAGCDLLRSWPGMTVQQREYEEGHCASDAALQDAKAFLSAQLAPSL